MLKKKVLLRAHISDMHAEWWDKFVSNRSRGIHHDNRQRITYRIMEFINKPQKSKAKLRYYQINL
jgi:hypothetical protein